MEQIFRPEVGAVGQVSLSTLVVARRTSASHGRLDVNLLASEQDTKCPQFFLGTASQGQEAFTHEWLRELLCAFPLLELILPAWGGAGSTAYLCNRWPQVGVRGAWR